MIADYVDGLLDGAGVGDDAKEDDDDDGKEKEKLVLSDGAD